MRYRAFARWCAMLSPALAALGWVVLTIRLACNVPQSRGGLGLENLEPAFWYSAVFLAALAGRERKSLGRIGLTLGIIGFLGTVWTMVGSR